MRCRSLRRPRVREADDTVPSEVSVFLGLGISFFFFFFFFFFFVALLCIVAHFGARKQHRHSEDIGSLDPNE
jgi:hypothetical protein